MNECGGEGEGMGEGNTVCVEEGVVDVNECNVLHSSSRNNIRECAKIHE